MFVVSRVCGERNGGSVADEDRQIRQIRRLLAIFCTRVFVPDTEMSGWDRSVCSLSLVSLWFQKMLESTGRYYCLLRENMVPERSYLLGRLIPFWVVMGCMGKYHAGNSLIIRPWREACKQLSEE